jgi:poly(A) polymerase
MLRCMADLSPQQRHALDALLESSPFAKAAFELGRRFADAGHELYLVGGTVRDALLGRASPDVDFTTDARPGRIEEVLAGWRPDVVWLQGARFGTVGARKGGIQVEITTFRSDVYRQDSRKPEVTFSDRITDDLARRDFTINAMAVRLPDGRFTDPHDGLADLARRRLRTPSAPEVSFDDDPLRMLRAARFVSALEVVPTPETLAALRDRADRLAIVANERIRDELDKLLIGEEAGKGLSLLVETGLSDEFLPELSALRLEQDPVQRHKDVLRHTYAVVERCEPDLVLRLAALLHDIGKPATRRITPDGVAFHHHEVVGARMARERLQALRYPSNTIDDVCALIELHLRFHGYGEGWTDSAVRRYVRDAGALLDRLNSLTRADVTTRNEKRAKRFERLQDELEERIAALAEREELDKLRPPLDGRQVMERLGIPPGPVVGEALAFLMELRMERGPIPEDDAYAELDAWAKERGIGG